MKYIYLLLSVMFMLPCGCAYDPYSYDHSNILKYVFIELTQEDPLGKICPAEFSRDYNLNKCIKSNASMILHKPCEIPQIYVVSEAGVLFKPGASCLLIDVKTSYEYERKKVNVYTLNDVITRNVIYQDAEQYIALYELHNDFKISDDSYIIIGSLYTESGECHLTKEKNSGFTGSVSVVSPQPIVSVEGGTKNKEDNAFTLKKHFIACKIETKKNIMDYLHKIGQENISGAGN